MNEVGYVYEPGQDSLMLARIAAGVPAGSAVLDVGCGSGVIAIAAAKAGVAVTAVDINEKAVEGTRKAARGKGLAVSALCSDLFENVRGRFDYVFFNPPYLPAGGDGADDAAWTGGRTGNELIFLFLERLSGYLSKNGKAFFVCSSLAGFTNVEEKLNELDLMFRIAAEEHAGLMETLRVYEAW